MTSLLMFGYNVPFTKGQLERELKRIGMENKSSLLRQQRLKLGEMMSITCTLL